MSAEGRTDISKHKMIAAELEAGGKSTREIAAVYGCSDAYVRAVRRREQHKAVHGVVTTEKEKEAANARRRERYRTDEAYRRKAMETSKMKARRRLARDPAFREAKKLYTRQWHAKRREAVRTEGDAT